MAGVERDWIPATPRTEGMSRMRRISSGVSLAAAAVALGAIAVAANLISARVALGEVIEAVVASVNDDIITRSDLTDAEQQAVADLYSRLKGPELDQEIAKVKTD